MQAVMKAECEPMQAGASRMQAVMQPQKAEAEGQKEGVKSRGGRGVSQKAQKVKPWRISVVV